MKVRVWAAIGGAAIGWGSGGIATRAALNDGVTPLAMVAIRGFIATAIMIGVLVMARRPWRKTAESWGLGARMSVFNLVGPFILYTYAYRYASAGFVGILIALVPIATATMAHYILPDEPLKLAKVIGLSIGFGGVGLLLGSGDSGLADGGRPLLAAVLTIAGVITIAYSNVYAKRFAATYDPLALMGVQFAVGTLVLTLVALVAEGVPTAISAWGWTLIAYMAVGSTVLPYLMYYWLLRRVTTARASTIGYFVPMVSLVSGAVLLDEQLQFGIIAGGVVILAGVVLAHRADPEITPV